MKHGILFFVSHYKFLLALTLDLVQIVDNSLSVNTEYLCLNSFRENDEANE